MKPLFSSSSTMDESTTSSGRRLPAVGFWALASSITVCSAAGLMRNHLDGARRLKSPGAHGFDAGRTA